MSLQNEFLKQLVYLKVLFLSLLHNNINYNICLSVSDKGVLQKLYMYLKFFIVLALLN
jgi:hypothetical protein